MTFNLTVHEGTGESYSSTIVFLLPNFMKLIGKLYKFKLLKLKGIEVTLLNLSYLIIPLLYLSFFSFNLCTLIGYCIVWFPFFQSRGFTN